MGSVRVPMPPSKRAKIFSMYDALKGFKEALAAKEVIPEEREFLTEERIEELNRILLDLRKRSTVTVVYYCTLERCYRQITGPVTKLDSYWQYLQIGETRSACKLKDKLYEICCLWIDGKTPIEISTETDCNISDVDDVCNKVISYRLNILIGNICDLINVPEEDDTKVNPYMPLNTLQNKIKYGVSSQTAISVCEKVFNDRVLASKISEILLSETIDTESIIRILEWFKDDVFALINDYPGYFIERLNYLLR